MKITMMHKEVTQVEKEVKVIRHAIIPSFVGGCVCCLCEDGIDDDNQMAFTIPYHIEYAHIKCFEQATE